jgi:hypothetical protein
MKALGNTSATLGFRRRVLQDQGGESGAECFEGEVTGEGREQRLAVGLFGGVDALVA